MKIVVSVTAPPMNEEWHTVMIEIDGITWRLDARTARSFGRDVLAAADECAKRNWSTTAQRSRKKGAT